MCTRFYVEPETEEVMDVIEEARKNRLAGKFLKEGSPLLTSGEIRPSNVVAVIALGKNGRRSAFPMQWGFRLPGRPLLVNARTETAAQKPTFADAWRQRRCVIPASWYYEWEHLTGTGGQSRTGAKYMIQPRGASVTWLAGLYRIEEGMPCFAVLTREPTAELRRIHDRMPLILPKERIDEWIRPETVPEDLLRYAVTDLILEKAAIS